MAALSIRNVRKSYGAVDVLKGIDLEVQSGEFLILVGPSGCGKSTLLNLIAGLDTVSSGEIWIGGRLVNRLSPKDRDIAMVFQSYALYPTMSVRRNLSFGLEMRKVPKEERSRTVERVAKILRIEHLLDRKPAQLSGGQRQRVAMGRAIARNPQLFLFDEPLSNLDAKLRIEMRMEIKLLHEQLAATIVYVTHDQIEAMTLGSRIAVMKEGEIRQTGTPQQIYDDPADQFVAGFMGSPSMNFIPTQVIQRDGTTGVSLTSPLGTFVLPVPAYAHKLSAWIGKELILGIRPEQITDMQHVRTMGEAPGQKLRLELTEPTGPDTLAFVTLNGTRVCCRVRPDRCVPAGQAMELRFDLSKAVFFEPGSERRVA